MSKQDNEEISELFLGLYANMTLGVSVAVTIVIIC